jgi:hypothetical protein
VVLRGVHHTVISLQGINRIDQSVLAIDDGLASLERLLVRKFHNALPQSVHLHCMVRILELLDKLENESLLFKIGLLTDDRSLE